MRKRRDNHRRRDAFTLIDLLIVISLVAVAMIGILLLRPTSTHRSHAPRITCVNNLRQIGVGFHVWANDHNDHFPMELSKTNGGTMESAAEGTAVPHLCVLSNELSSQFDTPKVFLCPADKGRTPATSFSTGITWSNISYFVGVDSSITNSEMLLSGDHNITNGTAARKGLLTLTTNEPAGWTHELHQLQGNAGLADGSVQQFVSARLREQITHAVGITNRLAMP